MLMSCDLCALASISDSKSPEKAVVSQVFPFANAYSRRCLIALTNVLETHEGPSSILRFQNNFPVRHDLWITVAVYVLDVTEPSEAPLAVDDICMGCWQAAGSQDC